MNADREILEAVGGLLAAHREDSCVTRTLSGIVELNGETRRDGDESDLRLEAIHRLAFLHDSMPAPVSAALTGFLRASMAWGEAEHATYPNVVRIEQRLDALVAAVRAHHDSFTDPLEPTPSAGEIDQMVGMRR